jgi:hypothetical protein
MSSENRYPVNANDSKGQQDNNMKKDGRGRSRQRSTIAALRSCGHDTRYSTTNLLPSPNQGPDGWMEWSGHVSAITSSELSHFSKQSNKMGIMHGEALQGLARFQGRAARRRLRLVLPVPTCRLEG